MKKFILLLHFIIVGVLLRFAIPKISGQRVSVEGFNEMSRSLPVSSDFFRVFTGVTELTIAFLSILFLLLSFGKINFLSPLYKYKRSISIAANGLLLATMSGALLAEFYARDNPKYLLVYIAVGLIIISIINLYYCLTSETSRI